MSSPLERLLAEFVDREGEIKRFRGMLDGGSPRVFCIRGGGGVGKSSLQAKMVHEVAQRNLRKAEIVWTDSRNHDYLNIMRKVRDDVDVEPFKPLTDLINYFTVAHYELRVELHGTAEVSVLSHAQITDTTIHGDVAGIVIKDLMLANPRDDMAVPESERMIRLTDTFLKCLTAAAGDETLVLFFDAVEKMTEETERWLWDELLGAIRDGRLPSVCAVLCGREMPDLDRTWRDIAEIADLQGLTREYIATYLERRGLDPEKSETLADALEIASEGSMLKLATIVDTLIQRTQADKNAG